MKTTNKKLSLCPCGFPVLKAEIPLGTEYGIDPSLQQKQILICGGCGNHIPVMAIYTIKRGDSCAGWLPREIFEE